MRIALHARPAVLASCALLGLDLLAMKDSPRPRHREPCLDVPDVVQMIHGDVITPPDFADARPYPEGMVIAPPATGDPMNALAPGALRPIVTAVDHVLSALLGALLAPVS